MRVTRAVRPFVAAFAACLAVAAAQAQPGPEKATTPDALAFELTQVSPSVIVARHGHGSNITCIALDDGLVFVDASQSTRLARRFREAMEARFGRPTRALILTHAHFDHILGMGAFADVPVLAADLRRGFFERLAGVQWTEGRVAALAAVFPFFREDVADAKPFVPTALFSDQATIGPPGRGLAVKRTGGHSACSSYVFFPAESVLVAGDLVQAERRPYFGEPDTDLGAWKATLKAWSGMAVESICPGHGPVVSRDYLRGIWEYFEALETAVARLKAEGLTVEQIAAHRSLPAGYWGGADPLPPWWRSCIAVAYRSE
jgi:glyoxylase-like metal-dependent hydrolase (beta-lactamase superfamily II)